MEKIREVRRRKIHELYNLKLSLLLVIGSLGIASTNSHSPTTTMNSSSIVYESSASQPDTMESEMPESLAQVALSPLLVAGGSVDGSKRLFNQLPLESLFPQIKSTTPRNPLEDNMDLTSALLNHSLHHGSDDELDRLVFSNLPEGSKLVLKTLKIMKTDENGNEEPMGEPAVSLDVLPIASTFDPEDTDDYDSDEVEPDDKDLASDASSVKAGYDSYGRHEKHKNKKENQHHGQDYGQDHKETLTDSKGKKVTNYKGREKGLTDFDHAHGNSQSNDGERFKNSKKKNKGRKVTGFKRVYHKEEFQRTEHFYDDEEAKKIAESYGLGDSKKKAEHGKKEDDRKYHGDRLEHTGGEKVKNEHSTHHGHHKGYNVAHENADKHKQTQQYASHQHTPHPRHPPSYHHHPNHRYNAAYSHPYPRYDPSPKLAEEETAVTSDGSSRIPYRPKLRLNNPSSTTLERPGLDRNNKPSPPILDQGRTFRPQTNFVSPQQLSYYYAPNFGTPPSTTTDPAILGSYYNDVGSGSWKNTTRVTRPRMKLNGESRYAGRYRTPIVYDPPSQYHSPKLRDPVPIPYYPGNQGKNLISMDKAVVTKVPPPHPYSREPHSREVFISGSYNNWNPFPSGSVLNAQNFNTTTDAQRNNKTLPVPTRPVPVSKDKSSTVSPLNPNPNQSFGWETSDHSKAPGFPAPPPPPFRSRDPRFYRPSSPVPYLRLKSNGNGVPLPPPPVVPNLPVSTSFYYGPTLLQEYPDESESESPSPHSHSHPPVQNYARRGPPSFSNFMSGLMTSVSEFFTRVG